MGPAQSAGDRHVAQSRIQAAEVLLNIGGAPAVAIKGTVDAPAVGDAPSALAEAIRPSRVVR